MEENEIKNNGNDSIGLLNLYQQDFLYRHTIYWNLFYKSMFAILGLISIPYFLYSANIIDHKLFIAFPILSIIVNIFSIILMRTEDVRMKASRERLNSSSTNYKQISVLEYLLKKYPKTNKKKR